MNEMFLIFTRLVGVYIATAVVASAFVSVLCHDQRVFSFLFFYLFTQYAAQVVMVNKEKLVVEYL